MSLIICHADNPNLIEQCRISRNYAKVLVSEAIFSGKYDLAFLTGLYSEQPVLKALDQSCILEIYLIELEIRVMGR